MAESLFHSVLSTLDRGTTSRIAQKLEEPEAAVSRGLESSMATVMAGLSTKGDDPGTLRKMLDLVPGFSGGWSAIAGELTNAAPSLLTGGKRLLSGLFGSAEAPITSAIAHEAGLGTGTASTLLAMAAPMVSSFLGRKIRDHDMTLTGLGSALTSEAGTLRHALPPNVADLIWRRTETTTTAAASPVIAQSVRQESSFPWGLGALAVGALALGGIWLFNHHRAPDIGSVAVGTANRLANDAAAARNAIKEHLPTVDLNLPQGSPESRLLVFVRDPNAMPSDTTRFDFDRWHFNTGSARLITGTSGELDNVAAIFKAYPQLQAKVIGYTDNRGSTGANRDLSIARADEVRSQLVARGVSADRLSAMGMGADNPAADNATEPGRAANRRVTLLITEK
jgi:outer membrane protein OmpA-like peptidoglycan-associated protein